MVHVGVRMWYIGIPVPRPYLCLVNCLHAHTERLLDMTVWLKGVTNRAQH